MDQHRVSDSFHDGSLDVLIVSQPVTGGVAVCVRHLTEAALAAGHQVTVVSPPASRGPLAGWVEAAGAVHVPVELTRQPSMRDIRHLFAIRGLAKGRDVVHLHSSKAGAVGRLAIWTLGRSRPAVIFTPHAWSWLVGGKLVRLYRALERLLALRTDAIVAVSSAEAAQGRAVLSDRAQRLHLIPNGVDHSSFSPDGPVADRDAAVPLIVLVGRLSRQKGQDVAIRAMAKMRKRDAVLRLIGDGDDQEDLRRLASDLGISHRIEWVGVRADTALDFRAADVVIAPSRWEGLSLVFLEAMACGSALVVTSVQGSEVVGDAGVIIAPEDPNGLAAAIDALLDDENERKRLGAEARQRSRSFELHVSLRRNLELWSQLAQR